MSFRRIKSLAEIVFCVCSEQLILLAFFMVVSARAAGESEETADPSPPPYKIHRQDEGWSMMRDPSRRADGSDELKYLPLAEREGWYASIGGESRSVYERYRNEEWGSQPQDLNGYLLQRFMLHADVHLGRRVRFFGQLQSAIESGRRGGPRPPDEDLLDVHQAFIDLIWNLNSEHSLTLRAGRQELAYGLGRLIDAREGRNVRQAFDGAKLMLRTAAWRVDGFVVKPVETDPGVFDDMPISAQTFWGAYAVRPMPAWLPIGTIDLYYLGVERESARFDQGSAREVRHTTGARLSGERDRWDYDTELIYQFGRFGEGKIRAWGAASEIGYTLRQTRFTPRLGFKANATSGDRDPNDPNLQTFNPLFPRGAYFGQLVSVGPLNHVDLHPTFGLQLASGISLMANWVFYWRQSRRDGVYGIPGNLLRTGQASDARFIGHQPGVDLQWQIDRHVAFNVYYARFIVGTFLRETPPSEDTTFFAAWLTYKF